MSVYLYRLHFQGPVHFGLAGIGLEAAEITLSSDSLTSALVNAFSLVEGPEGANALISCLTSDNPPFVLSSLFPFGPDPEYPQRLVEALVRPLTPPKFRDPDSIKLFSKELKRINYLHPLDFKAWISDRPLESAELASIVTRSQKLTLDWWARETRPRVALDRESQNSSVWSQTAVWFRKEERDGQGKLMGAGAGLYGLVRFRDESWKETLCEAFRILGDTGLGGERTYGFGLFKFQGLEDPDSRWKELLHGNGTSHVFLSLYYPNDAERQDLAQALEAWDFVEKRGYVVSGRNATTVKRKRMRMIVEGSVARKPLRGAMIDVTPDDAQALGIPHRVFRSGLAFLVPNGER